MSSAFHYQNHELHAEQVNLTQLAEQVGTPAYVYSRSAIEQQWLAFDRAFGAHPHLVCFAVKANSNIAVLNLLARLGAGFDIVSEGELERVLRAGGDPKKVVFSGVGKQPAEMARALTVGVRCFNVESESELHTLNQVAATLGVKAPVSLRVNPDVDAQTHPYISTGLKENKFGIDIDRALQVYRDASELPHINIVGVDCHIGSQLTQLAPFLDALDRVLVLVDALKAEGIALRHLDLGGGLGVCYRNEQPPSPSDYVQALLTRLGQHPEFGKQGIEIILEPGRAIVANAGVLLTRIMGLKETPARKFAIIDGAMNDLIRPALYGAWQEIVAVKERQDSPEATYDIVGPVCETGDFLGKERALRIQQGDLLAVKSAGAYGFVMSSNYNTRNRAAEVIVDKEQFHIVRARESYDYQLQLESLVP
ncbi:Diaminopimelate decarboxylase (DAP decarboxylase) [gamma proteobacterium HdN1]|nr:Diaminopimelate decarboxylase (DAP decarboxylase) [gamma proteobacterium HdN1]